MLPPEFTNFFITMASAGATLFGLIFVAISIAPMDLNKESISLDQQAKAFSSYSALLNPTIVSMFALVPGEIIGFPVIFLSLSGLVSCLYMILTLIQKKPDPKKLSVGNLLFIITGFILYSFEAILAVRLFQLPNDYITLLVLANLLIFISIFGIARAWELIGIHRFNIVGWLTSVINPKDRSNAVNAKPTAPDVDTKDQ